MKKQILLSSAIATSILIAPLANVAQADELKTNQQDFLKQSEQILKNKTQADTDNTTNNQKYDKPFEYTKEKGYNFGIGSSLSGAKTAIDVEKLISDDDISIAKKDMSDHRSNIAKITMPTDVTNTLKTGSAFAISKHILVTNNHVVNTDEENGFKPADVNGVKIYPQQDGNDKPYQMTPTKIKMLKTGDVALVYVKEDLSKYMNINDIASEKSIEDMKTRDNVTISGYPVGKSHEEAVKGGYSSVTGTPYDSKGKFLLNATSIHPVMYYKAYGEKGMSGSPVYNSKDEIIGVHAGILDSDNGNKGDTAYGYSFTKDLRNDILDAIKQDSNEESKAKNAETDNKSDKTDDKLDKTDDKSDKTDDNKSDKTDNNKSNKTDNNKSNKTDDNKSNKTNDKSNKTDDKSNKTDDKSNKINDKSDKGDDKSNKTDDKSNKIDDKSDKGDDKSNKANNKSDKTNNDKSNKTNNNNNNNNNKSNDNKSTDDKSNDNKLNNNKINNNNKLNDNKPNNNNKSNDNKPKNKPQSSSPTVNNKDEQPERIIPSQVSENLPDTGSTIGNVGLYSGVLGLIGSAMLFIRKKFM